MRPAMTDAGWSSLVARRAHNPKVVGSNPAPATKLIVIDNQTLQITYYNLCSVVIIRTRDGAAW